MPDFLCSWFDQFACCALVFAISSVWEKMKFIKYLVFVFAAALSLSPRFVHADNAVPESAATSRSWRTEPRHSAGIAPDPAELAELAIVQVYSAATYGWRGVFAGHPWIILKRSGERVFTRYDVIGWRGSPVVQRDYALPDGLWYGATPKLLVDQRGEGVDEMIDQIEAAIKNYPYADTYRSYPGPNSNTFIAHLGREVPALRLDLPATAIGKDYRPINRPIGLSSSGSGWQLSFVGLLGLNIGFEEGIEMNILGLSFGLDFNAPALRLPFVGRLGADDTTVSNIPVAR